MSTSAKLNSDKVVNKRATDPFDLLIFEQGLRAKHVIADKALNSLVVQLNNGMVLKVALDNYERLDGANQQQLENWKLSGNGIGIRWDELDEDISIKGLIKDSALHAVLRQLQTKTPPSGMTIL